MIEQMKLVTVVCLASDRYATVETLADAGVLHVREADPVGSAELDDLLREAGRLEQTFKTLNARASRAGAPSPDTDTNGIEIVTSTLDLLDEREDLRDEIATQKHLLAQVEPWGSFEHEAIDALRAHGLDMVLAKLEQDAPVDLPEGCVLQEISSSHGSRFVAIVAPIGTEIDVETVPIPQETDVEAIAGRISAARERTAEIEGCLTRLATQLITLKTYRSDLDEAITFARAQECMGETESLCYLQGYVSEQQTAEITQLAEGNGLALLVDDPEPSDPHVPTKVILPSWIEPIRIVFKSLGILPGYWEIDISACFLVFFSIFFAMLIGDAGYGMLFLLVTLALWRKYWTAPDAPFQLFIVLSVCTIIWGVLTGTYFAVKLPEASLLRRLPSVAYLEDPANMQRFCFLLGVIHLSIAHGWNALIAAPSIKALGQLAWIPVLWGNYFLALQLVLGAPANPLTKWFYIVGIGGIILFTAPQKSIARAVGGGVGALAMGAIGSFVDVVSYVRLFAVGAASVKVAASFNEMAGSLDGISAPLAALFGAVILVLGHGLNIMLGAMGVLVHGVRLNVLEFAGHVGLGFAGIPYDPLRRRKPAAARRRMPIRSLAARLHHTGRKHAR